MQQIHLPCIEPPTFFDKQTKPEFVLVDKRWPIKPLEFGVSLKFYYYLFLSRFQKIIFSKQPVKG